MIGRLNGQRRRIDLANILRASDWAKEYMRFTAEAHRNMTEDPRKADRLKAQQCVVCFYPLQRRVGGARCTSAQCGICQDVIHSGSTNIDVVCLDCGRTHDLCVHCGADIRLRIRRAFDQSAVMPKLDVSEEEDA
jgi:hypothetical protein